MRISLSRQDSVSGQTHQAVCESFPQNNRVRSARISPLCGSNGCSASIVLRFVAILPDAFAPLLETMCEILVKISHRKKANASGGARKKQLHELPMVILTTVLFLFTLNAEGRRLHCI